jgi:F0F1-type ATP synthase membrane subunit b/b'
MDIDNIIPHSASDFGAILFWVIIIILLIAAMVIYWYYRKISKKVVKTQEKLKTNPDTIDQMKKSEEESVQEPVEVKNNVEEMIEEEKNKL